VFAVIGWGNYCGFDFTTLISKALYYAGNKNNQIRDEETASHNGN